jgi:CPA2 family monovalent cation:H+ antiporter-2
VHHDLELVLTLTGGLGVALVLGLVTHHLRLSSLVGYLLAGVVVGPFTPGFVAHHQMASELAEIGVVLLMFGVGLHFHVGDLVAVRRIVLPGAALHIAAGTALGLAAGLAVGFPLGPALVLGLAVSVASTVVLLRVLSDRDVLTTRAGHLAVAWLLVEDVFTVVVLVLLPLVAGAGAGRSAGAVALSIALALLKIVALVAFTLVAGKRLVPRLLALVARTRSRELFTLTVLVLALGIAVGSAQLFGASMALGAFLAGMVVGQSEFGARAASDALPMRDAFAVLFFVSVGMLLDPAAVVANARLVAATLAFVLVGKPVVGLVVARVLRLEPRTAATIALALAQIGEFSFILAGLARAHGVLPEAATQALVVTAIVSITLNPVLFGQVERLARRLPGGGRGTPAPDAAPAAPEHTVVLVGYGPVGRTLARILVEAGLVPVVVEMNFETIGRIRADGLRAIHGDASRPDLLDAAGARRAIALVFTASGSAAPVLAAARELRGDLPVLARATYASETHALRAAGATAVVSAEGEVALAMAEHLVSSLGATRDQLDRARDRVRAELGEA